MSNAAVRKHITAYAAKPRDKKALRMATDDSNEAYQAYRHISHMYDRIWNKYIDGTLAVDRLDLLREAAADQMDVDMMRTP
jgi:phage-related tail protein